MTVDRGSRASTEGAIHEDARSEDKTTINAPAQSVFDYVSDFTKHGEWAAHGLQVTKRTHGPVAVGFDLLHRREAVRHAARAQHGQRTRAGHGLRLGPEGSRRRTIHHRFTVAASDRGTSLTKSADLTQPSFLAKSTSWRISKGIPESLRSDVEKIKARLESRSS